MKLVILFLLIMTTGCVFTKNQGNDIGNGEWMPLNDDYEEINSSQKYRMLGANDIFDGIAFWENSPIYNKPPYSFHWYGNKFRFWIPQSKGEGRFEVTKFELEVDKCKGLANALNVLREKTQESASRILDDEPKMNTNTIVLSPTFYKIKVFHPNMLGSIMLNNIKLDKVSWIQSAEYVKSISGICAKSYKSLKQDK